MAKLCWAFLSLLRHDCTAHGISAKDFRTVVSDLARVEKLRSRTRLGLSVYNSLAMFEYKIKAMPENRRFPASYGPRRPRCSDCREPWTSCPGRISIQHQAPLLTAAAPSQHREQQSCGYFPNYTNLYTDAHACKQIYNVPRQRSQEFNHLATRGTFLAVY